jgi:hypothetical protein
LNPELLPLPAPEQPAAQGSAFLLGRYLDMARTALWTHELSGVVAFASRLAHAISSVWEMAMVKDEADVEGTSARMWPW